MRINPNGKPSKFFLISMSEKGELEILAAWPYYPTKEDLAATFEAKEKPIRFFLAGPATKTQPRS